MQIDNSTIKLLVLDDDEMVRENLKDYLDDEGFYVKSFINGENAIDALDTEHFDVAIVDMRLPGIDGNNFIIQAHERDSKMKYIIHTGSSNYNLIDELRDIGVSDDDIYIKPVGDMGILVDKIYKLLNLQG